MSYGFKIPNIITIKGITLESLTVSAEEAFVESLNELTDSNKSDLIYKHLPKKFTKLSEWPKECDGFCWSCSRRVKNNPVPAYVKNIKKNDIDNHIEFYVDGICCSFNCSAYYIKYFLSNDWTLKHYLKQLYKEFKGHTIDHIEPSPHKTIMIGYHGTVTEETFEKMIIKLDKFEDTKGKVLNTLFGKDTMSYISYIDEV